MTRTIAKNVQVAADIDFAQYTHTHTHRVPAPTKRVTAKVVTGAPGSVQGNLSIFSRRPSCLPAVGARPDTQSRTPRNPANPRPRVTESVGRMYLVQVRTSSLGSKWASWCLPVLECGTAKV